MYCYSWYIMPHNTLGAWDHFSLTILRHLSLTTTRIWAACCISNFLLYQDDRFVEVCPESGYDISLRNAREKPDSVLCCIYYDYEASPPLEARFICQNNTRSMLKKKRLIKSLIRGNLSSLFRYVPSLFFKQ